MQVQAYMPLKQYSSLLASPRRALAVPLPKGARVGIRVQCDWCRETIKAGEPYMTVAIDGKIAAGRKEAEDVSEPARVYCGRDRDAGGRESCARRVLTALNGNPDDGPVDMGLEWRLVPVGAAIQEPREPESTQRQQVAADADLEAFIATIPPGHRHRIQWSGLKSLEEVETMSDAELMERDGIGWGTVIRLRAFIADRANAAGAAEDTGLLARSLIEVCKEIPLSRGINFGPQCSPYKLRESGIETVGDLKRAVESGSLIRAAGVGPKTFDLLSRSLRRMLETEGVPA